ncbi:MAG: methyltransferase domain-containing protein [Methanomicrobiaceae archaeon]|nr:methyltransferase domain-containing protein [Methanomicrobiaceae archaeon]
MKKVQRHYDEVAEVYDRHYANDRGRVYYDHVCDLVLEDLPAGGMLLDLGCGTGLFMVRYLASGGDAVGLDISRGMIARARQRCPACTVSVGTAEQIPFRDAAFDAVASILAFSYLQRPEAMLAESFRVLKPGGTIAVCTLGRNVLTVLVPVIYRIGEKVRIRRVGMADFGEHYYGDDEIAALFASIGFEDIRVRRCSFAHQDLHEAMFSLARKVEPFVEQRLPRLAYNICVSAKKPD